MVAVPVFPFRMSFGQQGEWNCGYLVLSIRVRSVSEWWVQTEMSGLMFLYPLPLPHCPLKYLGHFKNTNT